jgi:hypothetical protein
MWLKRTILPLCERLGFDTENQVLLDPNPSSRE